MSGLIDLNPSNERKCKEGILESYLTYAGQQESPLDFHIWVCISLLATTMGRNCFCNMGMWETYPNLYIILVGESAITHKSTAIKMGMKPLKQAIPDIPYLGDNTTAQALTSVMAKLTEETGKAEGVLEASELSVLLGNSKVDDTFLKRLTDFWDSDDRRIFRTIGRGTEELKNICLNILGGSTPRWLRSSVPEESLEGGFFSRLILVQRPAKGQKNAIPVLTTEQREALDNVKHDLQCIRYHMQGEFVIDEDAQQWYIEWYNEMNHPEKAQSFMRGYYGRKGDFLLKIAMCLSASYSNDLRITQDDLMMSLKLLNENEKYTRNLVRYMGTTLEGQKYIRVLNAIKRSMVEVPKSMEGLSDLQIKNEDYEKVLKVGISHSKLQKNLGHQLKRDDLHSCIESLIEANEITMIRVGPKGRRIYLFTAAEDLDIEE